MKALDAINLVFYLRINPLRQNPPDFVFGHEDRRLRVTFCLGRFDLFFNRHRVEEDDTWS